MAETGAAGREGIPDFQTLMLSVLQDAQNGEVRIGSTVERLAAQFALTSAQRADLLPSKRQTTFANRVHWAKSYLGKAGLVELTKRGHFRITAAGKGVLKTSPTRIDINYLKQFRSFSRFARLRETQQDRRLRYLQRLPKA